MFQALWRAGLLLAWLSAGIGAQTTEVPPEETEIVELWEMLEALELLEEGLDRIPLWVPEEKEEA